MTPALAFLIGVTSVAIPAGCVLWLRHVAAEQHREDSHR